jgi:hypothetical protein
MKVPNWAPASCHNPPAGRQRRGSAGGCRPSASRGTNPPTWRAGGIATKTQKLRPALSCEPLPNHVLPLAYFGAISDVYDSGVVRTDHHGAGERRGREVGAPNITTWRFTMHMLVAGKAHHRSGYTFHSRHIGVSKGGLHI